MRIRFWSPWPNTPSSPLVGFCSTSVSALKRKCSVNTFKGQTHGTTWKGRKCLKRAPDQNNPTIRRYNWGNRCRILRHPYRGTERWPGLMLLSPWFFPPQMRRVGRLFSGFLSRITKNARSWRIIWALRKCVCGCCGEHVCCGFPWGCSRLPSWAEQSRAEPCDGSRSGVEWVWGASSSFSSSSPLPTPSLGRSAVDQVDTQHPPHSCTAAAAAVAP